jgi:hypothetical protein
VSFRFHKIISKNSLDELKCINQVGSVDEYWHHFEKLCSRMLLEGRHLSERDFIDAFVMTFKSSTLDETLEYALYMETVTDSQYKNSKTPPNFLFIHPTLLIKLLLINFSPIL